MFFLSHGVRITKGYYQMLLDVFSPFIYYFQQGLKRQCLLVLLVDG